ncbi:germ cell nuclear acidic protein-like [Engystomops pustulosus]|uniref:germ cell nuclear acidic protein-like n=1 Tax=Engystomops pustulosus TaxID=76066 RepID=UPI003AFA5D69
MSKQKRKHCFVISSDTEDSGSEDQILVSKKSRKCIESNTLDDDETLHQSHPFTPSSPWSLEEEDGGSGPYQPPIADLNSPSSSIELVEESIGRPERPINYGLLTDLASPHSKYVNNFHENKMELTKLLYEFFNHTVFDDELPADMEVRWNKRMTSTAGVTRLRGDSGDPCAIIEISEKICDSAARLRDTLIHEMCHAACWVIDGDGNAGHGWRWLFFCQTAAQAHPDLPPISRYHDYEIHYPFMYECTGCQSRVGRWKASLDTQRFVCSRCKGDIILLDST